MRIPKILAILAIAWTAVFWVVCIAVPLFVVLSKAGLSSGLGIFGDPVILSVARATLWQAVWSTIISGVLGLFLGLWLGKVMAQHPQSRIQMLFAVPYGVPTVVAGMAWIAWLGRSGILAQMGFHLDWAYSLKAVILAHVFFNIPWVALLVAQSRKYLSSEQLEAATGLGAGWFSKFRFVVWPHVRWAFASSCAQVMSLCAMSFALVMILGGGPPVQTLETQLYGRLRYGSLDMAGAIHCAFWQLLITLAPWFLVLFFQNRQRRFFPQQVKLQASYQKGWMSRFILMAIGFVFVLPYLAVLNEQIFRIVLDPQLRSQLSDPLRLSLSLAGLSSLASVLTAVLAVIALQVSKGRPLLRATLSALLVLPSGVSVLVLSLGVWLAYGYWLDPFEGSFLAMVALQMTLFFPVAFRVLWPLVQGVQVSQLEAAVSLGASSISAFWTIELPRWRGPFLAALAGVAGASLGEVGAVSLFYSEKLIPLPLLVSRWMEQYHFEEAQGIAGLLFLLSSFLIVGSLEAGNRFSKVSV